MDGSSSFLGKFGVNCHSWPSRFSFTDTYIFCPVFRFNSSHVIHTNEFILTKNLSTFTMMEPNVTFHIYASKNEIGNPNDFSLPVVLNSEPLAMLMLC